MIRYILFVFILLVTSDCLNAQFPLTDDSTSSPVNHATEPPDEWKELPNATVKTYIDGHLQKIKTELGVSGSQVFGWLFNWFGQPDQVNGLDELINTCGRFRIGSSAISVDNWTGKRSGPIKLPQMFYCRLYFSPDKLAQRNEILRSFLDQQRIKNGDHLMVRKSSVFPIPIADENSLWCSFDRDDSFVIGTPAFFMHRNKDFSDELTKICARKSSSTTLRIFADLSGQSEALTHLQAEILGENLVSVHVDSLNLKNVTTQIASFTEVALSNPEELTEQLQVSAGTSEEVSKAAVGLISALKAERSELGLQLSIPKSETSNLSLLMQGLPQSGSQNISTADGQ